MTWIAASIMARSLKQALADAARAAEFGADLVEWRIDRFTDDLEQLDQLIERSPLPCIVTCRGAFEGGDYTGDEPARLQTLQHAAQGSHKPIYIDLELAAHQRGSDVHCSTDTGLILSAHDFDQRPADLLQKIEAMANAPTCRVIKVAWFARSLRANLEAFEILSQQYKPTIALCMGEFGLPSRVLAKKFDALLTFASIDEQDATAPGQPTITQLKQLYRWDKIDRDTQVFGVIGDPVAHSMSPAIHNAALDATGYNGIYLPMRIAPEYEHFKATVGAWLDFKPLHFRGASVTIPHKRNLLRFVRERGGRIEPLAEQIGAANTLTVRADGSLYASNTDYAAALDAVCHSLSITREELKDKRVAVIGAGGAARAIVMGFAAYHARLTIFNRTIKNAQQLTDDLKQTSVVTAPLDALGRDSFDIYINCTPIGMHPNIEATPMPDNAILSKTGTLPAKKAQGKVPGVVVFDTIYNPAETRLLREAKAAGCHTISGTDMFLRQAAAQFEIWTNQPAPGDVFGEAL